MKILLVHPPVDYDMPAGYRTESLGLGYIAAVLRRDGHEVEVLDAILQCLKPRDAIRDILARDFDCLGITAAGPHRRTLVAIVRAVKKRKKGAIVVAGGYLPTLSTEHLLSACPELDFVVRGEGEAAASNVFGRIARGDDWHGAPGVAFLGGKTPVLNSLPPLIQDLDSLPFPARDAFDQALVPLSAGIASSRGCYHRCSFCCIQSFYALSGGHAPRFRSPGNVVDEIESVIASTGVKQFRFVDDDFLGPGAKTRERVAQIAEDIRARKLGITFTIECRADEVDEDLLKLLKEVGLTDVFLGVESGVQRQLDTYNKRITVEQNRQAIEIVRRSGVRLRSGFIMFDPYTTVAELQENMQFIREMGLEEEAKAWPTPFVTKLVLHRGVPLVERLRADGLLREKGTDVDYVFKDWQVRLMARVALLSSACSGFFRAARRLFGRRQSYRS
jgi:radical SAM superfamily enzyme YgiQ (UPF0313 family)